MHSEKDSNLLCLLFVTPKIQPPLESKCSIHTAAHVPRGSKARLRRWRESLLTRQATALLPLGYPTRTPPAPYVPMSVLVGRLDSRPRFERRYSAVKSRVSGREGGGFCDSLAGRMQDLLLREVR